MRYQRICASSLITTTRRCVTLQLQETDARPHRDIDNASQQLKHYTSYLQTLRKHASHARRFASRRLFPEFDTDIPNTVAHFGRDLTPSKTDRCELFLIIHLLNDSPVLWLDSTKRQFSDLIINWNNPCFLIWMSAKNSVILKHQFWGDRITLAMM